MAEVAEVAAMLVVVGAVAMLGAMLGVVAGYIVVTEAVKRLAGWST